jgi:hypothetical protein
MKSRNEAPSLFAQFKAAAENHCREKIATLRVDNAPKLVQGQMNTYCKAHGIAYEKTVPDSPPQNGVAERTNLTICSMARAMLIDADLRDYFWPFAVLAQPTSSNVFHTPPYPPTPPLSSYGSNTSPISPTSAHSAQNAPCVYSPIALRNLNLVAKLGVFSVTQVTQKGISFGYPTQQTTAGHLKHEGM